MLVRINLVKFKNGQLFEDNTYAMLYWVVYGIAISYTLYCNAGHDAS